MLSMVDPPILCVRRCKEPQVVVEVKRRLQSSKHLAAAYNEKTNCPIPEHLKGTDKFGTGPSGKVLKKDVL
ncbi:hypothetical protein J3R82DRAFT_7262 [Butyriboletus roseoflavus]|nr:hypothetical protein J3R82DRAFT_7262 [Butyriboletus roseoflavus]